jgi:hypothetical protein
LSQTASPAVRQSIRKLEAEGVAMESFGTRDARPLPELPAYLREETDLFAGVLERHQQRRAARTLV